MNTQTSHRHNTQPLFDFITPQETLLRFQNDQMFQFGQPYHPQKTQPQRPNYENMGTKVNYGNAVGDNPPSYWGQMMTHLSNTDGPSSGPSHQPPLDHVSTQIPQTPRENRGRPRRQPNAPGCGTWGCFNLGGH